MFLGGGYVNLDLFGANKVLQALMELSPVRWINRTLLELIYTGRYDRMPFTLSLCFGIGILFLLISAIAAKREVLV